MEELKEFTQRCKDCPKDFTLTVGEQEFFRNNGLSLPKRCQDCRAMRKAGRGPQQGSTGPSLPTPPASAEFDGGAGGRHNGGRDRGGDGRRNGGGRRPERERGGGNRRSHDRFSYDD